MVNKDDGFRVFGGVLGVKDAYVDVKVVSVDYDGVVYFENPDNGNEYEATAERIRRLRDDELIVFDDDVPVPTHQIWTDLENIAATRINGDFNNVIDQRLEDGMRSLFRAIIEYGK